MFKMFRVRLQYDVIVTSNEVLMLVSIKRGDAWLYVGNKHTGKGSLIWKIQVEGCKLPPPHEELLRKML